MLWEKCVCLHHKAFKVLPQLLRALHFPGANVSRSRLGGHTYTTDIGDIWLSSAPGRRRCLSFSCCKSPFWALCVVKSPVLCSPGGSQLRGWWRWAMARSISPCFHRIAVSWGRLFQKSPQIRETCCGLVPSSWFAGVVFDHVLSSSLCLQYYLEQHDTAVLLCLL